MYFRAAMHAYMCIVCKICTSVVTTVFTLALYFPTSTSNNTSGNLSLLLYTIYIGDIHVARACVSTPEITKFTLKPYEHARFIMVSMLV